MSDVTNIKKKEIEFLEKPSKSNILCHLIFVILSFLQSKVEIDPAMQRDAGYYECQAYNKHAVETKVCYIY